MNKLTLRGKARLCLILICLFVAQGCRKDRDYLYSAEPPRQISNQEINKWLLDNPVGKALPIDWEKARQTTINGTQIVRVPLFNVADSKNSKLTSGLKSILSASTKSMIGTNGKISVAQDPNPPTPPPPPPSNPNYRPSHPPEIYFVRPAEGQLYSFVLNFVPDDENSGFGQNGGWTGKLYEWGASNDTVNVFTFVNSQVTGRFIQTYLPPGEIPSYELQKPQKLQSLSPIKDRITSNVLAWIFEKLSDAFVAIANVLGFDTELVQSRSPHTGVHDHWRFVSHGTDDSGGFWGDTGSGGGGYAVSSGIPIISTYLASIPYAGAPNSVDYTVYDYSGVVKNTGGPTPPVYNEDGIYVLEYLTVSPAVQEYILTLPAAPFAKMLRDYLNTNGYTAENEAFASAVAEYFVDPANDITLDELRIKYGFSPIVIPNNGIEIEDAPLNPVIGQYPTIGFNNNRGNTEDLLFGTNHDATGIGQNILTRTNDELWLSMKDLIEWGSPSSSPLRQVGYDFINAFRNNTTTQTEITNATLNERVQISVEFASFLKDFGALLRTELRRTNGDFNSITPIDLRRRRPIFGGLDNMRNGLTILINDTEQTTVRLESYSKSGNNISLVVEVTIMDHFGLDKHDALSKDFYHHGFQSWWVLQHNRGFKPFHTKIVSRKTLKITL